MKRIIFLALLLATCVVLAQNTFNRTPLNMDFVRVKPGEFMMGCSEGDIDCNEDERPLHRVQITRPFEIGKYEVTQAQWQAVMGSNPSTIKGDDRPVETINKEEAQQFLTKLNERNDGYRYRLPTEAEWEYAARAGTNQAYSGKLDEIAWWSGNSDDETHPVGKRKPNAWGIYDMQGNVREWVQDLYGANYYRNSPAADPTGPAAGQGGGRRGPRGERGERGERRGRGPRGFPPPDGGSPPGFFPDGPPPDFPPDGPPAGFFPGDPAQRGDRGAFGQRRGPPPLGGRGQLPVIRGGAWDNPAPFLRVSARYAYYGPTLRVSDLGFRVVREQLSR